MTWIRIVAIIVWYVWLLSTCNAQVDELKRAIDAEIQQAIDAQQLPGAVVFIGRRDETLVCQAYGHRQLVPDPLPMQIDTVFDLASLTKPIATASAIMILVDRGQIDLHQPVASYLPAFAARDKANVTVEQLMIHVAGLIPDNSMKDYAGSRQACVDKLFDLPLQYPVGTAFKYSDVGFQVLGELVREVSGLTLDEFVRREIFEPLGMKETMFCPNDAMRSRCATTQQRDDHWMVGEVHDPRAYAMGGVAGHAGLFSTASDLAIYARMMLRRGNHQDRTILKPETVALMTRDYTVPGGIRGLGWDKRTGFSTNRGATMSSEAYGHGGFTGTAIWIDPGLDLFVIFLSNRVHPNGTGNVNPMIGRIGTFAADHIRATLP